MDQELYDFLVQIFGEEKVGLAYSDKVTEPGLSIRYVQLSEDYQKELDGTTNLAIGRFMVQVWHDSMLEVRDSASDLLRVAEGTKFQIQNSRPVRVDGNKRKWHKDLEIVIMEDV